MNGFLLIDKPTDWTSHDVVGYIRGVTKIKKVGHAGTLDPFATGLLIVGIGRECTKRLDEFKRMNKEYTATIQLGATSDTFDRTGTITFRLNSFDSSNPCSIQKIEQVLRSFIGKQLQTPPMYSAKKVDGQKLYKLARKGIEIQRKSEQIDVFTLKLLDFDPVCLVPHADGILSPLDGVRPSGGSAKGGIFRVSCLVSPGTYIRTLVHDIGQVLGTGAYCEELRRTKIGNYSVDDAVKPKELSRENTLRRLFL